MMEYMESSPSNDFLVKTEIKESTIPNAGKGRFFCNNYNKGQLVRVQSIDSDLHVFKNVSELKAVDEDLILNFAYTRCYDSDVQTTDVYVNKERLFTNHSSNNNVAFKYMGNNKYTYTTRDVNAGEEMFQNYNDYTPVRWFEDYLHSIGKTSLREFALSLLENDNSNEVLGQ